MSRLKISHRLFIIVAVFMAPILYLCLAFWEAAFKDIQFAQTELAGTQAIGTLSQRYEGYAGGKDAQTEAMDIGSGKSFSRLGLKTEADALDTALAGGKSSKAGWDQVLKVMSAVSDASNLTLDPDIDSYYVMDFVAFKAPSALSQANEIVNLFDVDKAKALLSDDEKADLVVSLGAFQSAYIGGTSSLTTAGKDHPRTAEAVSDAATTYKVSADKFYDDCLEATKTLRDDATRSATDTALLRADYDAFQAAHHAVNEAARSELERLLKARIAGFETRLMMRLGIALGIALLAIAMGYGLARSIIRSINQLDGNIRAMGENILIMNLPEASRKDEIGQIARAVEVFRAMTIEKMADAEADNKRTAHMNTERLRLNRITEKLKETLNAVLGSIRSLSSSVADSTHAFTRTAKTTREELSHAIDSLNMSASDVEHVSRGVGQVATSIGDIAAQAASSAAITREISSEIDESQNAAVRLQQSVESISDASRLIQAIAAQTNLLALNATIESARAGEAGKGFAVVAAEVKALAAQTQRATTDIEQQISDVRLATDSMVNSVKQVSTVISQVTAATVSIATAVDEQSHTSSSILESLERAAEGNGRAVKAINSLPEAARHTETTAQEMAQIAQQMADMSSQVQIQLTELLEEMVDKRISARYGTEEFVQLEIGSQSHKVKLLDISETGARLRFAGANVLDGSVSIRFSDGFAIDSLVVWQKPEQIGINFESDRLGTKTVLRMAA